MHRRSIFDTYIHKSCLFGHIREQTGLLEWILSNDGCNCQNCQGQCITFKKRTNSFWAPSIYHSCNLTLSSLCNNRVWRNNCCVHSYTLLWTSKYHTGHSLSMGPFVCNFCFQLCWNYGRKPEFNNKEWIAYESVPSWKFIEIVYAFKVQNYLIFQSIWKST